MDVAEIPQPKKLFGFELARPKRSAKESTQTSDQEQSDPMILLFPYLLGPDQNLSAAASISSRKQQTLGNWKVTRENPRSEDMT